MLQAQLSMWSLAAELSFISLWSESFQPTVRVACVKKRLGQGTVVLPLFPSTLLLTLLQSPTHSGAVGRPHRADIKGPHAWAQPFCH